MKTRLTISLIFSILISVPTFSQVDNLMDSLVAYYPFNGNADDEGGNENHGTINGSSLAMDRFGNENSCYSFNGTGDYIYVSPSSSLNTASNLGTTISVWVKVDDYDYHNIPSLVYYGVNFTQPTFNNVIHDSLARAANYIWQQPYGNCYSSTKIYPNEWYNITYIFDTQNSLLKLYVNGLFENQTSHSITNPNNPHIEMGRDPYGGGSQFFHGKLDDIRVFNCALDSTQVRQLYTIDGILLNMPDTLMACHEESIELDAGSGYSSYLWNTGETTQTILATETGTYIVTVEDDFSNIATDSTYVNIINAQIAQNDTTICAGESIELTIDSYSNPDNIEGFSFEGVFNGHAYYLSDNWVSWTQARDICYALSGHLVTIMSEEESDFIVNFSPSYPNSGVHIGYTDEITEGNFKWITDEISNYTNWASSEPNNYGNEDFTNLDHGLWWDISNISSRFILELDDYANYSYIWSTGDTTATISVSPGVTTTYEVIISDGINTCTDSVTVYVNDPIQINLPDTLMACHQDSLVLDGGAGFENYLWSTGDTTQTLSVFQTGTYSVTVEDNFGCTATDSTYVNIISAHIAQNDTSIVAGESIELSITGGGSANITDGLVGYWPFNGNANDESGNGNDGTVNGASLTLDRFGNENDCYSFNGTGNYIYVNASSSLNTATNAVTTVGVWVNVTNYDYHNIPSLVYYGVNYTQPTFNNMLHDSLARAANYIWQEPYGNCYSTTLIAPNNWYFITYVFDTQNSLLKVYINGILENQTSYSITNPINPHLEMGRDPYGGGSQFYHGKLDDIRIYNRALSGNEIQILYYEGAGNYSYLWSTEDTTATISVSPTETTTYYCEITDGINWCTDSVTVTVENAVELELTAFLEGPFFVDDMTPLLNIYDEIPLSQPYNIAPWNYSGNESVPEISSFNEIDWVLVELLIPSIDNSFEPIARRAGFIMSDGTIKDLDGISNITFNGVDSEEFYIRIYHRNHISITSSISVTESNGIYSYDFTTDASKVIGGILAHKELNTDLGIWGMMAGDGDANGQIDNKDKNDVWLAQRNTYGYLSGDFDMNRQVSDVDKNSYWIFNAGKGIPRDSITNVPPSFTCGDPLIDNRDGQTYNTVLIGEQCWMAENLNIGTRIDGVDNMTDNGTIEKYCYGNNPANCDTYGGLYLWNELMEYVTTDGTQGLCPAGWHIPTDAEWCTLENYVDIGTVSCTSTSWRGTDAGGNLKETGMTHWFSPNYGATNSSGFTALGSGNRGSDGTFEKLKHHVYFWSSSEIDSATAWERAGLRYHNSQTDRYVWDKQTGLSVRCLKD